MRRYGETLIEVFDEAEADSDVPAPNPLPIKSRDAQVVKELRAAATEVAEAEGFAPELLARKRDVEAVFRWYREYRTFPDWFGAWRQPLVGEPCFAILEGSK